MDGDSVRAWAAEEFATDRTAKRAACGAGDGTTRRWRLHVVGKSNDYTSIQAPACWELLTAATMNAMPVRPSATFAYLVPSHWKGLPA